MSDLSWMLNPQAIRQAKECIRIVKEETGIRIKLSHPDFLTKMHQYTEESHSRRLGDAYAKLVAMAGVGYVMKNISENIANTSGLSNKNVG